MATMATKKIGAKIVAFILDEIFAANWDWSSTLAPSFIPFTLNEVDPTKAFSNCGMKHFSW